MVDLQKLATLHESENLVWEKIVIEALTGGYVTVSRFPRYISTAFVCILFFYENPNDDIKISHKKFYNFCNRKMLLSYY